MTNSNQSGTTPLSVYMTSSSIARSLTRCEMAMIRGMEGFVRWATELHKAVGGTGLSFSDLAVLHSIRMIGNPRGLSEILMFLNRNDVANLQYSLRKLEKQGLVRRVIERSNRETRYGLTATGISITAEYARQRDELLVTLCERIVNFDKDLEVAAEVLERLRGVFDQATHTVLDRNILGLEPPRD